jgi:hypothetical protein
VTTEQVRQWISDGRANAQTPVRPEGATEWKPLAAYPEFAVLLGAGVVAQPAPMPGLSGGERQAALDAVKGPAIALKVTAVLGWIAIAVGLVWTVVRGSSGAYTNMNSNLDPQMQKLIAGMSGTFGIVRDILAAAMGVLILMGASHMQNLRKYGFAIAATIIAMVPCVSPCCFLGLPFGIWALIVLNRKEVKSQFTE